MGDPELAMAFQNPKIQQAVMDCSSNPNNIMKYQNDPEIMNVFMKLATMFPGATDGGMPMGGMRTCRTSSDETIRVAWIETRARGAKTQRETPPRGIE